MSPRAVCRVLAAALLAAPLLGGCAASTGDTPEAAIAAALTRYRHQSEEFVERRKELVRDRVAVGQAREADTARTQVEVSRTTAVWRIGGDKSRSELYAQVIGATREAGAQVEALDQLLDDQRDALAKADTRMAVRGDQLGAAAKSLLALADERKLRTLARRYVDFLIKTREELKKLEQPAAESRPPPQ